MILSETWARSAWPAGMVLIPSRAFIDSERFWRRTDTGIGAHVLIPSRAFIDSEEMKPAVTDAGEETAS